jgi:hypothetical protein
MTCLETRDQESSRKISARGHLLARRKSNLFNLSKVIFHVLVQGEFSERPKWNFFLRPNLGQVEDVPAELFSLFRTEDLEVACPARVFTILYGVEEILRVPVRILRCHVARLGIGKGLATLVRLTVDLDIIERAVRFGELIGMAGVAVHMAVRIGRTTIGEKMHDLVS